MDGGININNNCQENQVKPEILTHVLSKRLGTEIIRADYRLQDLQGGTLGDVRLVTGIAESSAGEKLPFQVVWKTQRKWERYGDPRSWRREYDLYASDLGQLFNDTLRWPACYHSELNGDEIQLWMEYIEGVSGLRLTPAMYEHAAEEWGRFQGRMYAAQPEVLQNLPNVSKVEFMKNFYLHYRSWPVVYDYIRSENCELPQHLCHMLIDTDNRAEEIFGRLEQLPVVLCHRDFWVTNLFYCDGQIILIDWDTAGWGYLGEDIASLIADEADVGHMVDTYHKCVSAYYKGFSAYAETPPVSEHCIHELILLMFGYRLVENYKFAETPEDKALHATVLQKIYEMKNGC